MDSSCSGQPIHLWQFLKELLLKPHSYGRFIRWLNKEKGELRALRAPRAGPQEEWDWAEGCSHPRALNARQPLSLDLFRV